MFIRIKNVILREEDIKSISTRTGYVRVVLKDNSNYLISCEAKEEPSELIEAVWDKINPSNKKKGWLF
ncbi:hypothetical protein [Clostridium perfringens]|uniref:hypothetical protein n=1 Tax=Clostridium perfringens TaxID=1502 RepID=UPI00232B3104|nr:hypothetical protein [Clostridium perfringens]MDB2049604.1 hypothetical protein [Clostridium perfringens]